MKCTGKATLSWPILLAYFGGEAAAMELDGYCLANVDLGGVAEEVAGGIGGDSVAAFENFQGAALLELERQALQAFAFGAQESLGADAEIGAAFFEAQAERGNFHAKIECGDTQVQRGKAFARLFEACAKARGEARGHFIGALTLLAEEIERATEATARGEFVDTFAEIEQPIANEAGNRLAQVGDVFIKFAAGLYD
jgi:hypothetical protein